MSLMLRTVPAWPLESPYCLDLSHGLEPNVKSLWGPGTLVCANCYGVPVEGVQPLPGDASPNSHLLPCDQQLPNSEKKRTTRLLLLTGLQFG